MNHRRRGTSAVLTEQVAGGALREIMAAGGALRLPEARPTLRQVPLEQIVSESDLQARGLFDPQHDAEDADLVDSVRQVGIRVPVHLQDQGDATYRIRSGHRRVSAARLAGLDGLPAIVWPPEADAFDSALDTWLENLHRKDLSPLERGRTLLLLMDRFGLPRAPETATRLGLSKTSFYRYLALSDAPADVKEALEAGVLGVGQAERVAAIEADEVRGTMIRAAKDGVSGSWIDEAIERHRAGEAIPDGLLEPDRPSRGQGQQAGRQDSSEAWSRSKARVLRQALGLNTSDLDAIARALIARRVSAAQATAAALLVSSGQAAGQALKEIAAVDRRALRAVEALFNVVYRPSSDVRQSGARAALRRILGVLEKELKSSSGFGGSGLRWPRASSARPASRRRCSCKARGETPEA